MRTKVTLTLVFLNIVLLAVILHTRREWHAEQDLARLGNRVLDDQAIGMTSLEITVPGSDRKVRLERSGDKGAWELKAPIQWPANDFAIRRVVHELEFLEAQTSFSVAELQSSGQSLADYGLDPARLILTFTRPSTVPGKPDTVTRLKIGDTAKVNNSLYVLSPDEKTVHVVGRSLTESLIVGIEGFRTDTLFTIPVFEVRSLGLQNAAPAPRVRLRRDNGRWSFEAPIVTRAAKAPAELVISGLNRLRAIDFVGDIPSSETGLDQPALRVTLEGNSRRETLLVGKAIRPATPAGADSAGADSAGAETLYHARMEDREQVFITSIPDDLFDKLRRAQETLRDTRILDFDPATITSVSLSAPGLPEPLVLRREESAASGWRIVRPAGAPALPADTKLVEHLLQRLSLLTATGFLRDAPSDADIENYGFNLPQREITLSSSPEAAGQPPASRASITLQLGVSNAVGGSVQARVLGQPFIYSVAQDTLTDFPVAAGFYRERVLRTLPEGARISGLTLVANDRPDTPLVSVKLADGQSWDDVLADRPEDRREAIKTILAQLAPLRAHRFVNERFTETTVVDGKPAPWKYTLRADIDGVGAADGVLALQIAERSGGGTQLAGSKELGVVFSLEQAFLDALWTLTYGERDPGPPEAPAPTPPPASEPEASTAEPAAAAGEPAP